MVSNTVSANQWIRGTKRSPCA